MILATILDTKLFDLTYSPKSRVDGRGGKLPTPFFCSLEIEISALAVRLLGDK